MLFRLLIMAFAGYLLGRHFHIEGLRVISYYIAATVFVIILVKALLKYFIKKYRKNKLNRSSFAQIDEMEGDCFEKYLKEKFERRGYKVYDTPASNDYGADLILEDADEVIAVQAKRYNGHVGTAAVQEVAAAVSYYDADRGMVITNSYFTKNAKALAASCGVELWDRDDLKWEFSISEK